MFGAMGIADQIGLGALGATRLTAACGGGWAGAYRHWMQGGGADVGQVDHRPQQTCRRAATSSCTDLTKLFDTNRLSDASNSLMPSNHVPVISDPTRSPTLRAMSWVQATVVPSTVDRIFQSQSVIL